MKQTRSVLALTAFAFAGLAGCMDLKETPDHGRRRGLLRDCRRRERRHRRRLHAAQGLLWWGVGNPDGAWWARTRGSRASSCSANGLWNDYNAQLGPAVGRSAPRTGGRTSTRASTRRTPRSRRSATRRRSTQARRTSRLAESSFIRALMYLNLVRTWGAVQLDTLEPTEGVVTTASRTPPSEVYAKAIIPDLEFAIANLPAQADRDHARHEGRGADAARRGVPDARGGGRLRQGARPGDGGHRLGHVHAEPELPRAVLRTRRPATARATTRRRRRPIPRSSSPCTFIGDGAVDPFGNSLHLY